MTTLSDIITAINNFTNAHGYPPDTIHLSSEQQDSIAVSLGFTLPRAGNIQFLYGIRVVTSDVFALAKPIK